MATVVNGGQVQLNNGQTVTPQLGGWYDGQQFWGGALSAPGQFNAQNNQPGQQGGAAPVQNSADASYLASRGDTTAPNRVVSAPNSGTSTPSSPTTNTATSSVIPTAPTFDLNAVTNAAYNTPEIQAATKAITDRQAALAKALTAENDNPFYSEATLTGKIAKITNAANNDIKVQQDQLALLKADAAIKVNAATGQYNINRQAYQDTISQFNDLVKAGGLANASTADLANYSVSTGIPVSMLQSIQQKEKDDNIKTQLITGDDGTISIVDTKTGQIISQTTPGTGKITKSGTGGTVTERTAATAKQALTDMSSLINGSLDASGKKSTALQAGKDGYLSPKAYQYYRSLWVSQGLSTKDFESQFSYLKNPNQTGY